MPAKYTVRRHLVHENPQSEPLPNNSSMSDLLSGGESCRPEKRSRTKRPIKAHPIAPTMGKRSLKCRHTGIPTSAPAMGPTVATTPRVARPRTREVSTECSHDQVRSPRRENSPCRHNRLRQCRPCRSARTRLAIQSGVRLRILAKLASVIRMWRRSVSALAMLGICLATAPVVALSIVTAPLQQTLAVMDDFGEQLGHQTPQPPAANFAATAASGEAHAPTVAANAG